MMEVWHGIVRPEHINNNKYLDHLNTYIQTHTQAHAHAHAHIQTRLPSWNIQSYSTWFALNL